MSDVLLEASDVAVVVGQRTLVDGVSLPARGGEVIALVGANGAGKSTLLGVLAGDRRCDRGAVVLHGRPLASYAAVALARVRALLPQHAGLTAPLTALEVVQLGQAASSAAAARQALVEVDLAWAAERRYPSLSGGERARVQLARVRAQLGDAPGVLLLDEPTAALDPRHQLVVTALMRRTAAAGHAVIVVLHDLATAARVADRVAVMHQGRLLALAPPADALRTELLAEAYGVPFEVRLDGAGRPIPLAIHPARTESVNQPHLTV